MLSGNYYKEFSIFDVIGLTVVDRIFGKTYLAGFFLFHIALAVFVAVLSESGSCMKVPVY
jgi:hypothetical protein